jgi:hypothetical protein
MGVVSGLCSRWRMKKGIRKSSPLGRWCKEQYGAIISIGNNSIWQRLPQYVAAYYVRSLATMRTGKREGKFWPVPSTMGRIFEEAIHDICHEVALIWEIVPKVLIEEIVRKGDWRVFWKKAKGGTPSLESGLHFSHYKAGVGLQLISHVHAMKSWVTLKTGFGYERCACRLLVMLEKIPSFELISKLRSILLMEADFNCINKILFGYRLLRNVRRYGFMPDKIFSKQNWTAEEGTLSKVLFYDIVRQTTLSAGISSVDADNCYDRVSHAIAMLVFCSFGASKEATGAMLKTIQERLPPCWHQSTHGFFTKIIVFSMF